MPREAERPFGEDEDANRAVHAVVSRYAQLATETKILAIRQFRTVDDRRAYRAQVLNHRGLIESRARSGGVVDAEMPKFWDAVQRVASAKLGRKIELYPIRTDEPEAYSPEEHVANHAVSIVREILEKEEAKLGRQVLKVEALRADLAVKEADAERVRAAKFARAA